MNLPGPAQRDEREPGGDDALFPTGRTPAPSVMVLDYGSGNLRSAQRALAATGAQVEVSADTEAALACDGLVVPGVGAFAACMAGLAAVDGQLDGGQLIAERARQGRPVLAICVGHQILFSRGVEHGQDSAGCGLWPGVVEQLQATPLPHMGWNSVEAAPGSRLFDGVAASRFYFVHSFGVRTSELPPEARVSWAEHNGDRFIAAVEWGPISSTQFHPEKSGAAGARLLRNWVASLSDRQLPSRLAGRYDRCGAGGLA